MKIIMTINSSVFSRTFVILASAIFLSFMSSMALAFDPTKDMTNQQTYDGLTNGDLILIDIRTKPEWINSGVAKGALTIDMQDPEFLNKIAKIRLENPDKTLAFICASGRRSTIVQTYLAKNGYENIYSVFGGTTGNGVAGWIKDGFPVIKYEQ